MTMATDEFNPTLGPDRVSLEAVDRSTVDELRHAGLLVIDGRRARSSYFDGRFLAARDLTRDQNYILTRQADLSRAGGVGVIAGLQVSGVDTRGVRIGRGQGVTMAGELVTLAQDVVVSLDDVPELARLEATSGITAAAVPAQKTRTGLYVLALRPIEYTTRQIVKYPTSVEGKRSLDPGDIVEAVALTLVPWRDDVPDPDPWRQRARASYTLFVEQSTRGIPAEALPLAMVQLERGFVRWLDPYLVRREIGAEHGGVVGFGVVPRALREAHLIQYDQALREIVTQRQAKGMLRFAASDYFDVLPPAGRLPAAAIAGADFTQFYFPAQTTVELSIVNEDDVTTLVEDSLLLPPIDVTGAAEDLDHTRIQILIPMAREARRRLTLGTLTRPLTAPQATLSRRLPAQILELLTPQPPEVTTVLVADDSDAPTEAAWRAALAGANAQLLWYVRARTVEQGGVALFPNARRPTEGPGPIFEFPGRDQ
jgi:hypothetical protein